MRALGEEWSGTRSPAARRSCRARSASLLVTTLVARPSAGIGAFALTPREKVDWAADVAGTVTS